MCKCIWGQNEQAFGRNKLDALPVCSRMSPAECPHQIWVCSIWGKKKVNIFFNCKLIKLAQRRALLHSKHSLALYSVIKCTQRAQCGISLHRCRNRVAACSPVTSADHLPHIFLCFFTLLVSLVAVHSSSLSLAPGERGGAWPTAVFLGRRQLQVPTYWGGATADIKMQLP